MSSESHFFVHPQKYLALEIQFPVGSTSHVSVDSESRYDRSFFPAEICIFQVACPAVFLQEL